MSALKVTGRPALLENRLTALPMSQTNSKCTTRVDAQVKRQT